VVEEDTGEDTMEDTMEDTIGDTMEDTGEDIVVISIVEIHNIIEDIIHMIRDFMKIIVLNSIIKLII
jgi:hypothetical protein